MALSQGGQTQLSQALHTLTNPLLDSLQQIPVSLCTGEPSTAVMIPWAAAPLSCILEQDWADGRDGRKAQGSG